MNFSPFAMIAPPKIPILTSGLILYADVNLDTSYNGSGTIWKDIVSGYEATLYNGVLYSGGTPEWFYYDGTNDYSQFPTSSTTNFDRQGSYTVGTWCKLYAGYNPSGLLLNDNGASWSLRIEKDTTGYFNMGVAASVGSGGTLAGVYAYSTTLPSNGTWYYVVGVWSSGVEVKIYLNGVNEASTATTRDWLRAPTTGWTQGRYQAAYARQGNGTFEVYNRVLTAAEIKSNFDATKQKYGY